MPILKWYLVTEARKHQSHRHHKVGINPQTMYIFGYYLQEGSERKKGKRTKGQRREISS